MQHWYHCDECRLSFAGPTCPVCKNSGAGVKPVKCSQCDTEQAVFLVKGTFVCLFCWEKYKHELPAETISAVEKYVPQSRFSTIDKVVKKWQHQTA